MKTFQKSTRSLVFDLYLKPSLLVLGMYQLVATGTFTAQQILLAAYLDDLGYLLFSGIILGIYFVFWFLLGPVFAALSDLYGRKLLIISSNWVCAVGFFGIILSTHPFYIFIMNAILGIGSALRIGSTVAFWVQNSPEDRIGESLAYGSIISAIAGVGGTLIGISMWSIMKELSFLLFGIFLVGSSLPIFFLSDQGKYIPLNLNSLSTTLKNLFREGKNIITFFSSKVIIKITIHWVAFSTIISFGTFMIPIFERLMDEIPDLIQIPFPIVVINLAVILGSALAGLLVWGRVSDKWDRKPVLIIGFTGVIALTLLIFIILTFGLFSPLVNGLMERNIFSLATLILLSITIFTSVSLIPIPIALISDNVGSHDLAKALSLRQASIGTATVIGTIIGGFIISSYGIGGLILLIFVFLVISTSILFL